MVPKSKDKEPGNIFFLTKQGIKVRVKKSEVDKLETHYNLHEEYWNKDNNSVNVATAQRAGTWLHKQFLNSSADAYSKLLLHIGPKLSNPIFCNYLNTCFSWTFTLPIQ